jgi:hypothetical protein
MDKQTSSGAGWQPPQTEQDIRDWFFAKHGDDSYTRGLDRKWSRIGRMVEKGARIDDGRLG